MATRKGATKTDARGRRFRWNGRKWVQIKAQGNGRNTTSSRNRSARQNRSNATVTRDNTRTSTGSARVTGGERPQLPPASQTRSGSGTNNRPGRRTTGQGGNPVRTRAAVTRDQPRVRTNTATVTGGKETKALPPAKPKALPPAKPTTTGPSKAALDAATKRALASQRIGTPGLLGGGMLALDGISTASDLIQSIARGEGYGAIPRLLQQGGKADLNSTGSGRQYALPAQPQATPRRPMGNIPPSEGTGGVAETLLGYGAGARAGQPPAPLSVQQPSQPVNEGMTPTGGSMPAPAPSSAPSQANQFAGMSEAELMRVWAAKFPGLAAKLTDDDYGMEFLETPQQRRRRMMKGYPGNQNY